jgi:ATP-dependent Lhr-like helicase
MSALPFHDAVSGWFARQFDAPTAVQQSAWAAIRSGRHTLIAAPTGSGKTLAAFMAGIDELVHDAIGGVLDDSTRILYVSPLKALSNDIHLNLEQPLKGIQEILAESGLPGAPIFSAVRTGDTPQSQRAAMRRQPPHILVTTPESLYILLTSDSGREMLSSVRSVIIDEIHAVAGNKRGSHLALSLERLQRLTGPLQRIGLSATQKPIEEVARFLVGSQHLDKQGNADCVIVDSGHERQRDLAIEMPSSPLEAVMAGEVWAEVYDRLATLIREHRTTLVFVNTRRAAERLARHLGERVGEDSVTAHHGSLSRDKRFDAEQRLKRGQLRALVATASLELGIDIGDVDLVCQVGATKSISVFLQRIGRAAHQVDGIPKGRLFPGSRDELVECVAILDAVQRGELDRLQVPPAPLDVLAQQIVAMTGSEELQVDELYTLVRRAWPYRELARNEFDELLVMLADGFSTRRGRRGAYIHLDRVNGLLRARRGARLTAITCGGAIPDAADYDVVLEPAGVRVGSVDEDFAIESLAGDIFQLGNNAWRILRIEEGRVRVEDARGQPPNIPFWFGEAPGRSDELSLAVSRLRQQVGEQLQKHGLQQGMPLVVAGLQQIPGVGLVAASQLVDYLAAAQAALGVMPTQQHVVFERFFDESGGMQLVIHSPFGVRLNRAWGLALRKRFCRKFNFELQAAALEDALVLSLGATHSFELAEVARYLAADSVRHILIQALLDAPMFTVRWRWNSNVSLAVPRFRGGRKVPPYLQRLQAEDLVSVVFPDQLACFENIAGEREVPDHPLVRQTLADCLTEVMDIDRLEQHVANLVSGRLPVTTCDLTEPSPLAQEILTARPYAFLDDAPLEERRTRAVVSRRWIDPHSAADIGRLDAKAIERVRNEAWPMLGTADECHDALLQLFSLTGEEIEASGSQYPLQQLIDDGRACWIEHVQQGRRLVAVERLPYWQAAAGGDYRIDAALLEQSSDFWTGTPEQAIVEIVRGRLECSGPLTADGLADTLQLPLSTTEQALLALENEGFAMRGSFTAANTEEWCERRLLARINHYTLNRLRAEIEPVSSQDFMRFLAEWQHLTPATQMTGPDAVSEIIAQLEGLQLPAVAWEQSVLPARIAGYQPGWLDQQCLSGHLVWGRLAAARSKSPRSQAFRFTPVSLVFREHLPQWLQLSRSAPAELMSAEAQRLLEVMQSRGASFFSELVSVTGLLRTQLENALSELVARGLVSSDSFSGLRALLVPSAKRPALRQRGRRRMPANPIELAGRWGLLHGVDRPAAASLDEATSEMVAMVLLRRYGFVTRRILERESLAPPWRDLLRVYRRMEARGEIRGGRFIARFSGEQFALPEALTLLRKVRKQPHDGIEMRLSASDPLNLTGIIGGDRVSASAAQQMILKDGILREHSGEVVNLHAKQPPSGAH